MDRAQQGGDSWRGGPVLVTGATGFIGARLVERLLARGDEVHATTRRAPRPSAGLCWHRVDLLDEAAVLALIARLRPERVFHLAGFVSGTRASEAVLPALKLNLLTTVHLLIALERIGTGSLVQAGSMEEPVGVIGEAPSSPYAASKLAAADYVRLYHRCYGLPATHARIFMGYGPGQEATKLIPYVIQALLSGQSVELRSGDRRVDWIFLEDIVDGLLALSGAEQAHGKTVDLGSGQALSVRALVEKLATKVTPGAALRVSEVKAEAFEVEPTADLERSYALTKWRPRVSLDEGLDRTLAWYRAR